jgi:hypothetical protein
LPDRRLLLPGREQPQPPHCIFGFVGLTRVGLTIGTTGCLTSAPARYTLEPTQIPGCYAAHWSPRPALWPWSPVSDTVRLGQPDTLYASTIAALGGPVKVGLGPMPSAGEKVDPAGWASWRLLRDTLVVGSPGINQAIAMHLLPASDGFTGEWIVHGETSEPERGQARLERISCK